MRILNSKLNLFIGLSMLLTFAFMTMSMTTSDVNDFSNTEIEAVSYAPLIDYADDCVMESMSAVACSSWEHYYRERCACNINSYKFHKDYYKRFCWDTMSNWSWQQISSSCFDRCYSSSIY